MSFSCFLFMISFLSLLPRGMSFGPIHSEHAVNSKDSLLRWWRWIWMVDAGWCLVNAGEYYMTSPRKKSKLSKLNHCGVLGSSDDADDYCMDIFVSCVILMLSL